MLGTFLMFGSLALLVLLVVRRTRENTAERGGARPVKTAVEVWVEDQVAAAIAKKLDASRDEVLTTLRGNPEPELVSAMEQAVGAIQLGYERLAYADEAELHVAITFEGGATADARKRWSYGELPQVVRDEFARTGASRVYRTWEFPWSEPDTQG